VITLTKDRIEELVEQACEAGLDHPEAFVIFAAPVRKAIITALNEAQCWISSADKDSGRGK
jgi:hypothetical protein